jgi:hypothetical protein
LRGAYSPGARRRKGTAELDGGAAEGIGMSQFQIRMLASSLDGRFEGKSSNAIERPETCQDGSSDSVHTID